MRKQIKGDEKTYIIKLSDGKTWAFSAVAPCLSWLEDLSRIMQMKEFAPDEKIDFHVFFVALNKDNLPPGSGDAPWEVYKQGAAFRIWSHKNRNEIFAELNMDYIGHPEIKILNMWASLKIMCMHYVYLKHGGPVHAALAELNGTGILIAASGNTGKSTCSRRLPPYWTSLSDDTALIIKAGPDNFRAHPLPTWSDHLLSREFSTFNSGYSVPLKAIFFLEQASEDSVVPINKAIATQKIFASFMQIWKPYLDRLSDRKTRCETAGKIFDSACDLSAGIPCYKLKATLHGRFWENIEEVI